MDTTYNVYVHVGRVGLCSQQAPSGVGWCILMPSSDYGILTFFCRLLRMFSDYILPCGSRDLSLIGVTE